MKLSPAIRCLTWIVAACHGFCWADATLEPKTLMTERGRVVLKDDFDQPTQKPWRIAAPDWETIDGALKATHRKPYAGVHGPVMEHPILLKNAIVQVEFKLEGSARAVVHFNKKNGHLCRALMQPTGFYIVRRDSGGDKGIRLDNNETPVAPEVWHVLVVETYGREMLASLDGKEVIFGARDDLDQEKTALILEAAVGSVWFKKIRVWEALPAKDWEANRANLEAGRKAAAPPPK